MRKVIARYNKAILPEHRGNPLIEALPPLLEDNEILMALSNSPPLDENIRWNESPSVRGHYVDRIKYYRCPQTNYIECYKYLTRIIRDGYAPRNPLKSSTQQYLHYYGDERPEIEPLDGYFHPNADTLTIVGISGSGKTTMIEQILGHFPQVINHTLYNGIYPGVGDQVIWVKVNCPYNASVRDLCESILLNLDNVLGLEPSTPPTRNGALSRLIAQRIKAAFLGVLVIDEMQRLKFSRTGGESTLIDFLHEIVNSLGVSLVFCGNHPFEETLTKKLRIARRAESGGFMYITPPDFNTTDWQSFINYLWPLQWTNVVTPLTQELNEALYLLSKGNIAVAQMIYRRAQMMVIGSGNEIINKAVLHSAIPRLSASSDEFISTQLNVTTLSSRPVSLHVRHEENSPKMTFNKNRQGASSHIVVGDLSRPQHIELAERTMKILNGFEEKMASVECSSVFRTLANENKSFTHLSAYGLLCTEPAFE